jgi:indolepyruvate ferredoxin oxidoreductase beta subunit
MKTIRILITGVGGQGTLLASRVLGALADALHCDVKVSEVHGMAQRGGSVVTYVCLGDRVASPLIEQGEADFLLAFEQLEAVRYMHMVRPGGTVVVNTQKISPMPVIIGAAAYPEGLLDKLREAGLKVVALDALALAQKAGNVRAVNTALMGALAREMGLEEQTGMDTLAKIVPAKTVEVNKKAFKLGYER